MCSLHCVRTKHRNTSVQCRCSAGYQMCSSRKRTGWTCFELMFISWGRTQFSSGSIWHWSPSWSVWASWSLYLKFLSTDGTKHFPASTGPQQHIFLCLVFVPGHYSNKWRPFTRAWTVPSVPAALPTRPTPHPRWCHDLDWSGPGSEWVWVWLQFRHSSSCPSQEVPCLPCFIQPHEHSSAGRGQHIDVWGPVPQSPISLIVDSVSCQFVCEYETDSLLKRLNCNVENQTNSPGFSPFKLLLVWRSEIEMKNFTNPGLA